MVDVDEFESSVCSCSSSVNVKRLNVVRSSYTGATAAVTGAVPSLKQDNMSHRNEGSTV